MIPYLQVEGLTRYWGELVLFEDLNFTIAQGQKVALIARNGAGKTTLLNTIMGTDLPDAGTVTFTNDITVGYLYQNPVQNHDLTVMEEIYNSTSEVVQAVREYEIAIQNPDKHDLQEATEKMDRLNAWDFEVKIKQILSRLKITNFDQKIGELSGGQQKRVSLANVLINNPDLLILDEPTNHLDLDMIEWLEEYLLKMNKTLFMVTHDRYFLDRICNEILELDQKSIFRYKGNYSYFIEKRAERQNQLRAEVEKARNLMRTEQEWMRRMPKARGSKSKYRVESFYDLKDKASQNLSEEQLELNIKASRLGKKVIDVYNLSKSFGDLKVLNNFSYKFSRFEKIGIVGENGTGKSTLLNLITGAMEPDSGRIEIGETVKFGYYRQEGITFATDAKVIDIIQNIAEYIDLGNGKQWNASQLLTHFLFSKEIQHGQVETLSGGEKRRLYLCTILMKNPNFLILDEPTNDLDIMTLNVLEEYLQNFNGCVVVVSHDRYFMDKIVEHVFAFEDNGAIKDFPGNYSVFRYYKDNKDKEKRKVIIENKKETTKEKPKKKDTKKLSFNEKREFEQLSSEIEQLESQKQELEDKMSSGEYGHEKIQEQSDLYEKIKAGLDAKELRWLELSEKE
ncbi:MAG: ABC-F family ATP-binding cassette domain-containing protein [Prolixibacteraceae bacterium]|jgi:ATP-binding cassette subfamily F protein uup|nr:ABC-F family ATP-binding cassette domain-containing protein [Prolixibacteraceae bacterium]